MIYKNKYSPKYNNLISLINKAFHRNYNKILVKSCNNNLILLQNLVKDGLIISYRAYNNLTVIYINNKLKTRPVVNIKNNFSKNSISLTTLQKLKKNIGFSSYYYLNTDKGMINSYEAINKNIGGKALFKIV